MNDEEIEIEISADGKVVVRTVGIKGPRCLDVAEAIAQIVGPRGVAPVDRRVSTRLAFRCTRTSSSGCAALASEPRRGGRAMQCPSCRFENMPGLDSCGRCGTSLGSEHGHDRHQPAPGLTDREAGAQGRTAGG